MASTLGRVMKADGSLAILVSHLAAERLSTFIGVIRMLVHRELTLTVRGLGARVELDLISLKGG